MIVLFLLDVQKIEHPYVGEIIYVSWNKVKSRRWAWCQEKRSKVTERSKNFFIPIDGFISNKYKVLELQNELVKFLKDDLGLEVYSGIVDKEHRGGLKWKHKSFFLFGKV